MIITVIIIIIIIIITAECTEILYFFIIKPTRCTNFTNLFCHDSFQAGPVALLEAVYKPV
jgi:hypothetical protein